MNYAHCEKPTEKITAQEAASNMDDKDLSELHYRAAVAATQEEAFTIAESELRKAIQANDRNAPAHRDLGWLLYGMFSKIDDALISLQRAKELDGTLDYLDIYLGLVFARLNRPREAEASFLQAVTNTSDPSLAHAEFADFLATQGRMQEAEEHFVEALSVRPDLVMAIRDYARFLAFEGRNEEAEKLFLRALTLKPDDKITKRYYSKFLEAGGSREE